MAIKDELPDTIQGINNYKNYAINQIKKNNTANKRLDKLIAECEERIRAKEKEKENG